MRDSLSGWRNSRPQGEVEVRSSVQVPLQVPFRRLRAGPFVPPPLERRNRSDGKLQPGSRERHISLGKVSDLWEGGCLHDGVDDDLVQENQCKRGIAIEYD